MKIKKSTLKQIIKEEVQNYAAENNLDESIMDRIKGVFGRGKKEEPKYKSSEELFKEFPIPQVPEIGPNRWKFANSPAPDDKVFDYLVRIQGLGDEYSDNKKFKIAHDAIGMIDRLGLEPKYTPVSDYTGFYTGTPGKLKRRGLLFTRTASEKKANELVRAHKGYALEVTPTNAPKFRGEPIPHYIVYFPSWNEDITLSQDPLLKAFDYRDIGEVVPEENVKQVLADYGEPDRSGYPQRDRDTTSRTGEPRPARHYGGGK